MISRYWLIGLAVLAALPRPQNAPKKSITKWDYSVVATPDFDGPFRGSFPSFKAPAPIDNPKPNISGDGQALYAVFEVIVGTDGKTTVELSIEKPGPKADKSIREVLSRWQFEPARLDGMPIRVRLRVSVYNTDG